MRSNTRYSKMKISELGLNPDPEAGQPHTRWPTYKKQIIQCVHCPNRMQRCSLGSHLINHCHSKNKNKYKNILPRQ